jgi:hypothetical protein
MRIVVMGQKAKHEFCFKMGKTATETFQLINQAYGDNTVSLVYAVCNGI